MEFALSPEQQELATTVRGLLAKRADPRVEHYDAPLWSTLCEQIGVAALAVPEEYAGFGASLFETSIVLEELGRSLAPAPLLSTLVTTEALLAGADADAAARLLPRIAAGEIAAFVDGDGPALDADHATILIVADDDGLFELTGAETTWLPTMDQTIRLGQVRGGTRTPIGSGPAARERARLAGAVGCAALATGLAARGLEMTVGYARERVQFDRPIGSFQALKHRMADMLVLAGMSRSASWAAAYALATRAADAADLAHGAKSYCCEAASRIAGETIQLHGGIAITWEHDAHLVFKRAHALQHLFGTPLAHRAAVGL